MEALSLFVLKKALGRFIRFDESQKRSLDSNAQFGVSLSNVALDAESCNAALSQAGVPVAIKEANIRELSVRLKSPELVAKGVVVELALAGESAAARSKQAQPLSSSVHFAREYLSQAVSDSEDESDTDTGYSNESTSLNGATALARAIDSVLNSAAFSIHDVTLKLHISHFVIHMHIALLDYKNSDLNHSHSKESRSGISGVLARISNKQATFKGVSLRICQLDDTNPSGPPIFESRLFVMSDAEVENLIKLNVKQDLGLEQEAGLAGSSISGPTPVWDIDISFETMVYSMLDLQTLDCIKQVLASINSEGMGVRSRPSDDATTASFASDNSNSEKRKSQSFRIEIRLPIYMGFLLYSNTPLSPESIQLLIDQNEKKIAAESIHHLKLEMNGIRILFAHDSQGRQKLSFDTLRTDVSEFTTGTPHELDLPINKYNSLALVFWKVRLQTF
ncbi:hypothetical protein BDR26DRAFT_157929 [Obelidium mucronatum]|nr:hypothetical protein BDR26DRAFT_157929 [Obelidium mucronatum]